MSIFTRSAVSSLAVAARTYGLVIVLAVIASAALASSAMAVDVQRWQPYDAAFTATEPANPFTQDFKATVTGPGGISFTSLGFFDGSGTWKIRVGPTTTGTWSVTTISSNSALNGRTASFNCIANSDPDVHGGLRVDPQKKNHFIREDGTPYYLLGYEANWLWAVDQTTFPLSAKVTNFLDQVLVANGFNHVLMNSYAYDTTWKAGKSESEDWGPPALLPWLGSKGSEDFTRMNLPYWNHYDQLMEAMRQRGITAHIYIRVHNKPDINIFPANNSTGDNLWWQWMVARYAAYPNVVFDGAKEWNYESSVSYKQARLQYIRDNDPYDRLTTAHTDYSTYDNGSYNNVVDFRTDQKQDTDSALHQRVISQRQQRSWPIFNSEPNYEAAADGSRSYGNAAPADQVLRSSWAVTMAGGYMAYYYTWTAWDVLRTNERPIGYTYHRNLGEFFRHTNYQNLVPSDNLVSNGSYCLANPGNEYVVYRTNTSAFTLNLTGISGTLPAQWFNVRTGEQQNIAALGNGTANLTPPSGWNEVALRVGGPAWNQQVPTIPTRAQVTAHFGTHTGDAGYDAVADGDHDGKVDALDLSHALRGQ